MDTVAMTALNQVDEATLIFTATTETTHCSARMQRVSHFPVETETTCYRASEDTTISTLAPGRILLWEEMVTTAFVSALMLQ